MSALTVAQQNAFVIAPKVTSFLSLIGSTIILSDVVAVYRGKRQDRLSPRHRILAGMSFCDLLSSSGWFLTSWAIPSDIPYSKWNVGNQATCTLQGFLIQWSIGSCFYSCCLAVYYFLVIRRGWSDERIRKCAEPLMHLTSIGFTFGSAIAGLALTLYNPIRWGCAIAASPLGCNQSYKQQDGGYPCTRGNNAYIYVYALFFVPVWSTFIVLTTCMVLIYMRIRRLEQSMLEYQPSHSHAKAFAFQASMYVGAFFMSWSIATSASLLYILAEKGFFWHIFVGTVLAPSQGFFNMVVYKFPEYQRYRRRIRREFTSRQAHLLRIEDRSNSNSNNTFGITSSWPFRYIFRSAMSSSEGTNSPNENNALTNVQEQHKETASENDAVQSGDVTSNEVSGLVREQPRATSLQAAQLQMIESSATIDC
jgi:hypothetical protein